MSEVENFAEMTDEELKEMALGYHWIVYVYGQVSRSDLNIMRRAMQELDKRGYEIFTVPRLVIQKPEEEELTIPRPTQEDTETSDIAILMRRLLEDENRETKDLLLALVSAMSHEIMRSSSLPSLGQR